MEVFQQIEKILANSQDTNATVHALEGMVFAQDIVLILILIILGYVVFSKRV